MSSRQRRSSNLHIQPIDEEKLSERNVHGSLVDEEVRRASVLLHQQVQNWIENSQRCEEIKIFALTTDCCWRKINFWTNQSLWWRRNLQWIPRISLLSGFPINAFLSTALFIDTWLLLKRIFLCSQIWEPISIALILENASGETDNRTYL